jgi:hypothetical protein
MLLLRNVGVNGEERRVDSYSGVRKTERQVAAFGKDTGKNKDHAWFVSLLPHKTGDLGRRFDRKFRFWATMRLPKLLGRCAKPILQNEARQTVGRDRGAIAAWLQSSKTSGPRLASSCVGDYDRGVWRLADPQRARRELLVKTDHRHSVIAFFLVALTIIGGLLIPHPYST